MNKDNVLKFWFEELTPEDWFRKSDDLDSLIKARFSKLLEGASQGELFPWRDTAEGRVAEIIVLDQFSRNIHRGTPKSFSSDPLALGLSQELVIQKLDKDLPLMMRSFAYMPYMHSESKIIHLEAIKLFSIEGLETNLDFEVQHKLIIDRFGRYPHRNEILGRTSTKEELEFLKDHKGF